MAFLGQTFRTEDLPEDTGSYDPIPEGWYQVRVAEASLHETKAGTGEYLRVRYDVVGPTHQGRVVFGNFNLRNPNPKAEQIALQQFGGLLRAIGLAECNDSDLLIGGECQIKVSIREGQGQYGPSNEVKAFKALSGSRTPAQASAPAPAPKAAPEPAQPVNGTRPPWAR